jgi:hypothetical protein
MNLTNRLPQPIPAPTPPDNLKPTKQKKKFGGRCQIGGSSLSVILSPEHLSEKVRNNRDSKKKKKNAIPSVCRPFFISL